MIPNVSILLMSRCLSENSQYYFSSFGHLKLLFDPNRCFSLSNRCLVCQNILYGLDRLRWWLLFNRQRFFIDSFVINSTLLLGQTQNLKDPFKNSQYSAGNLVSAFFAGLLAFDGWDVLNMGTEEIRNPRRLVFRR